MSPCRKWVGNAYFRQGFSSMNLNFKICDFLNIIVKHTAFLNSFVP